MQPSLGSHLPLHVTADVLVPVRFAHACLAKQLREPPSAPEALIKEPSCIAFCSSADGGRKAPDATQVARLPRLRCHHVGFWWSHGLSSEVLSLQWSTESRILTGRPWLGTTYIYIYVGQGTQADSGCICLI